MMVDLTGAWLESPAFVRGTGGGRRSSAFAKATAQSRRSLSAGGRSPPPVHALGPTRLPNASGSDMAVSQLRLTCRCLESAPANGPMIERGRPEPRCAADRHSFAQTDRMGLDFPARYSALKDALIGRQTVEDGCAVPRQTSRRTLLGMCEPDEARELPKCL